MAAAQGARSLDSRSPWLVSVPCTRTRFLPPSHAASENCSVPSSRMSPPSALACNPPRLMLLSVKPSVPRTRAMRGLSGLY